MGSAGEARADRLWALIDAGVYLVEELRLDRVLRRIVQTACKVVGARYGALGVLDENRTGLSNFIFEGLTEEDRRHIGGLPAGRGLLGAVISDPQPIRLSDLMTDPRRIGFPPGHPPMHSFLGVPIRAKGQVFGNLYLTEKHGGDFTDEDERIAVALAAQAGVAIANADLYAHARASEVDASRRLVELESVQELGAALLSELDPSRVLRLLAMRARELIRADTTVIALKKDENTLVVRVAAGVRAGAVEGMEIPIPGSLSELVMNSLEPMLVADAYDESRASPLIARATNGRSVLFSPLVERRKAIGVLAVIHEEPGRFNAADMYTVNRFASLASLAFRNAELIANERMRVTIQAELAEARVRAEIQGETLKEIIRAQEDERRRVARELHDSAGQALASVLLGLKVAGQEKTLAKARERLVDLRQMTADAAAEVRRISFELRPSVLDDLGLRAAIERLASDLQQRTGLKVCAKVQLSGDRSDSEVETVVYRIVQEALSNATKHSGADQIAIEVSREGQMLRLVVSDNGTGFEPEKAARGKGLGLQGMKERAQLVGGQLFIEAAPGKGSVLRLDVPIKPSGTSESSN